ncbi:MAG: hypothetical protein CM15mV25_0340 [uncultured marine virus]|nr:MAG: hypothetical protein CM15mV25_0340 [uncultured marine virus]
MPSEAGKYTENKDHMEGLIKYMQKNLIQIICY